MPLKAIAHPAESSVLRYRDRRNEFSLERRGVWRIGQEPCRRNPTFPGQHSSVVLRTSRRFECLAELVNFLEESSSSTRSFWKSGPTMLNRPSHMSAGADLCRPGVLQSRRLPMSGQ